ncbi:MAG: helicase-exonuclease AddAB subunit AddB [Hespellia sp.]|nr:helicase-exonuclease AddAB subunit AddB [Hespellia sp.]
MALQFIFGNSGSGKSYTLYRQIIDQAEENPNLNYLVIVPEQFTMQTQRDLVMAHPKHGIMNIDVLSFGRMAHRIFEEVGADTRTVLDDEGKNLILRKIAGRYEENLKVLKGNLKKQGYISEVKSVISEFTQYDIGLTEIDRLLEDMEPSSYLSSKLQDIRMIYEGFYEYLAEKYITKEELLDQLCQVAGRSRILSSSVVVFDGFTGFTPVQVRLLGELMSICREIIVTVEMDSHEDAFRYDHPYQLFALSKQMVTSLSRTAMDRGIAQKEPQQLYQKPVYRFRSNEAMQFLEANLFRYSDRRYEKGQDAIEIHLARNPREEVDFAAREIRRLVREEGYRYSDIAVIASDMNLYADYVEKLGERYQIPIFMDHKRSILLNAFVEYLRSLLAMVEQNFSYESVFRFLRTGFVDFTPEEIDCLENYCVALGIKGYKKWQGAFVRRSRMTSEAELEELNHIRVRFVEQIDGLVFVLKQRKKTVRDVTVALYEFIAGQRMQERLLEREQYFQESGELALAKEYAQIYRTVLELLDKFVELLGEEPIALKEYCELLDAGMEEAKVGVIPPSLDQVVVGDMERTRLKDIKALILLGVNDTLLPGKLGQGGILSEHDREKITEEKLTLSPGAKEKTYVQKFYLYLNLTKPDQKLYLTFSKASADGKTLRPAYLIQDLRRMYPALSIVEEEGKTLAEREMTADTGISYLIDGLRRQEGELSEEWMELYTWYFRQEKWREKITRLVEASFYRKEPDVLSQTLAEKLFGADGTMSVTRMEKYAACAYAHFLYYGLRLKEREEYTFEAMDLGNIAHSAMERFAKKMQEDQQEWTSLSEEESRRRMDESVEESITEYSNTVLYSTARNEYMINRIKKMMYRTVWALQKQLLHGDFKPSEYELNFGSGKIDRIDTCEDADTVYVKVIDYKTGSKAFDLTSLYHGLQLQLPVYLNAAMQVEAGRHPDKEVVPAGIFYYRIKDPIVEKLKDEQALSDSILKELRLDGVVNMDENAIGHMEKELSGNSLVIPVGRTKNGQYSKASKVLSGEEFGTISEYTRKITERIQAEIQSGRIEVLPYEMGQSGSCQYCGYKDICGFDSKIAGCHTRRLSKMKEDAVLNLMKREM